MHFIDICSIGNPDYTPVQAILFEGLSSLSSRRECVDISITNDTLLEDTESFDVSLTSSDSTVNISRGVSRVYIIDDDQVRVGLKERAVTVSEDSQFIPVCVELVGRTQEAIEVLLESQSNSAQGNAFNTSIRNLYLYGYLLSLQLEQTLNLSQLP